jgi:putative hydrolase of the HAD superfamily
VTDPVTWRAVIFDLGGVVLPSPFDTFAEYERAHGLPERFIRGVVAASADHGAWARLERGELDFAGFTAAFAAECAEAGGTVDATELMTAISRGHRPRPEMVAAIRTIRDRGLRTGALTNNWASPTPVDGSASGGVQTLSELFDTIVESAVEGLRKPDPRVYELVCARLQVAPSESVFLDDLGVNLKPARAMGMTTIKVTEPRAALSELSTVLGFAVDGA